MRLYQKTKVIIALLSLSVIPLKMGLAQSSVEDSSLGSIESIGNDMINLLDDLSFGEVDPTQRLSMEPVFQNAANAVNNSPVFREAQAQKTYLLSVKNELDTAFNPTVTADGGVGRRTFSSNTSNGSTVRTTGNFIEQSITTSKMLFDFGATDAQKQAAQYNILAVDSKIESTKSELLLEAIIAFYEVQRNLLQSRLARENLQARKTFVNFIRERNTLGASSSADVVRAESRVAEALDLLSSALRALSEAQARYRQYYNSEAEPYILPREINVEDLELFEVEKYALQNPSFIEAEYQIKVIMAQIDTLKAQKYGRVVVQGTLSNSRSPGQNNFNDDISVGLNFQTELYSGGVEESKLEQAQARLLQAELSRDSIRVGIIKELREKFATYEGGLSAVENELDTAFNPTVTADGGVGRRTFSSNTSNGSTVRTTGNFIEQSITTSKMLFDFGATDAQKQAAQYNILAVDSKIESTKSELLLEAIIAFYEVQRNLLQSRLARENLQARKTFVNFIRERNTLGASSSADVVRAESRVAEALDLLSSALRALSEAQARYRQYYNSEAEPYILPREINVEDLELFEVEKYALQNPSFIEAEYQIKVIMAQIDTLKAQKYGRVVVQGTLSNSRSPGQNNFNDDISVGLNFQTELYSGGVEESKLEQAQARLLQAELSRDSIRVGIIKELREKFATYEGELSAVDARLLVLDGSKETYSITKELYAFSRISLFEVLSSQEELFNSGRQLIDSIVDRAIAKYRLSHATQTLVEKVYDGRS